MRSGTPAIPLRIYLSAGALAVCLSVSVAHADVCGQTLPSDTARGVWAVPLDRRVTIRLGETSLRTGLDRLAAAARIRLSYAAEFLPLERLVCATYSGVPAGAALADLLRDTAVEPIVVGGDQIVLAPVRRASRPAVTPNESRTGKSDDTPSLLASIIVSGNADDEAEHDRSIPITVVTGRQLVARGGTSLAQALDGLVPGIWIWTQSPATPFARFGSVRGASSFGASYPKVYIDGIEAANPQLVSRLIPESIDRIEILRGPQGAALYGADAISGVINVFTRHDGAGGGSPQVQVRSATGVSSSSFANGAVLARDLSFGARGGSSLRSAGLQVALSSLGDYIPGASSRQFLTTGNVRLIGSRTTLSLTARLFDWKAGAAPSPLVWKQTGDGRRETGDLNRRPPTTERRPPSDSAAVQGNGTQNVREYTAGATVAFAPGDRWTHSMVVGLDGYRSGGDGLGFLGSPPPNASLTSDPGGADRGTFRASSAARFGDVARIGGVLTLSADHSLLRESIQTERRGGVFAPVMSTSDIAWRSTTGAVAQSNLSFFRSLYLSGGFRIERNDGYATHTRVAALPMVSAAYSFDAGQATLKLRSSYGKAIRLPRNTTLWAQSPWAIHASSAAPDLAPEQQSGVDLGADLSLGRALAIHVTRFDQRASGLIQAVATGTSSLGGLHSPHPLQYQYQNVGDVSNRGWELEGSAVAGRLTLTGTLSLVDSRVQRLSSSYTGELQRGDRMLEVPARIASLTGTWTTPHWGTSWTVSRASDWIGYDQLAVAAALSSDAPHAKPGDGFLRQYWSRYSGVTRLRASATRDLFRNWALVLIGDNLLGYQRGEPDNATVVPGRTLLLGLKARFE